MAVHYYRIRFYETRPACAPGSSHISRAIGELSSFPPRKLADPLIVFYLPQRAAEAAIKVAILMEQGDTKCCGK